MDDRGTMRRILVVEYNPDLAMASGALLAQAGYDARVAMNGDSALEQAAGFIPDPVLLDASIPRMERLKRRLRALRGHSRRMIACVTPSRPILDRQHLTAEGFDDVLAKPLSLAEVNEALRRK